MKTLSPTGQEGENPWKQEEQSKKLGLSDGSNEVKFSRTQRQGRKRGMIGYIVSATGGYDRHS